MVNKFKNWLKSDNKVFAKGMSFSKMFLIFVLFSFLGVIYEEIIGFVKHHPKPILDYYYSLYPYSLTDIFSKLNIQLPQRKSISEGYKEDIYNNTNKHQNLYQKKKYWLNSTLETID